MPARPGQRHVDIERDTAIIDDDHAVGERDCFRHIVRDEDGGELLLQPDAFEKALHFDTGKRVEGAERFVEREYLRVADERTGKRNALTLAA